MQNDPGRKGQLDALRAFAIIPVLYLHLWNGNTWLGQAGVSLFFVLSGYLITRILLRSRGTTNAMRNFYIRRMLRIAPIYYGTLAVAWILNFQQIRNTFPWHFFYLSNVLFTLKDSMVPWATGHFWTLSVEEQFYLVWPFIILLLPLKTARIAVWGAIAAGVAFRLLAPRFGMNEFGNTLVFGSLDKLGGGAALAIYEARNGFPRWLTTAGWVALVGAVVLEVGQKLPALWNELQVVAYAAVIAAASQGISGAPRFVLDCKAIRYLGRISYGIYLYHLFLLALALHLAARTLITVEKGPLVFLLIGGLTVVVAAVSWHFFEQPINRFRTRFAPEESIKCGEMGATVSVSGHNARTS